MKEKELLQKLRNLLYSSEHISVPNSSYLDEELVAKEIVDMIKEDYPGIIQE